jgi:hypothetical protein
VILTDGRELARFTGFGAKARALRCMTGCKISRLGSVGPLGLAGPRRLSVGVAPLVITATAHARWSRRATSASVAAAAPTPSHATARATPTG